MSQSEYMQPSEEIIRTIPYELVQTAEAAGKVALIDMVPGVDREAGAITELTDPRSPIPVEAPADPSQIPGHPANADPTLVRR